MGFVVPRRIARGQIATADELCQKTGSALATLRDKIAGGEDPGLRLSYRFRRGFESRCQIWMLSVLCQFQTFPPRSCSAAVSSLRLNPLKVEDCT